MLRRDGLYAHCGSLLLALDKHRESLDSHACFRAVSHANLHTKAGKKVRYRKPLRLLNQVEISIS